MQHRLVTSTLRLDRRKAATIAGAGVAWLLMIAFAAAGNQLVRHDRLILGSLPLWQATVLFIAGWQVMVIAMMAPASLDVVSFWPKGGQLARFIAAYAVVWTGFGTAIFYFDVGVHAAVNNVSWLSAHAWVIAGVTLMVAGAHEASPLKLRSVAACRALMHRVEVASLVGRSAARVGFTYAWWCVAANAGVMLLAFALGAASLPLMAAITVLMAFEVHLNSAATMRLAGAMLMALGVAVAVGPFVVDLPFWALHE